jgi:hypothetical protein
LQRIRADEIELAVGDAAFERRRKPLGVGRSAVANRFGDRRRSRSACIYPAGAFRN